MCVMHALNMSAQDSGTDTSQEQELPKEVVKLQRARCLGIVRDCHVSSSFSLFFFFPWLSKMSSWCIWIDDSTRWWTGGRQFQEWFVYGILRQEPLVLIRASSVLQYLASPLPQFQVKNRGVIILSLPDSQGCCEAQLVNYSKASE